MVEEPRENTQNTANTQASLEPQASSNRRIAKNALMLYVRMFLTMIVGLYTSRVVLATLGVEDYGIYGVVGGVVGMLGFLNASMSGATSRFLTFELGRGDSKRLADTFSSALIVHIGIAIVVFILAETVGLWFLCNKLVIPEGRMTAAHWVYQCSIASAMLGITQVPYNASIIAHEKMDVYAYVEILNVMLKLLIVYLLVIGNFDKLILYAILVLTVSVLVISIYRIYCIRHFPESHFHLVWKKDILKPLLSFSGWDLYGNASTMARAQGVNMLVNIFFGAVANAAVGIGNSVQNIIMGFATNISTAVRPQIVKSYSIGDLDRMSILLYNSAKYLYILLLLISMPLIIETHFILHLWLGVVPKYAVWICRLMIVFNFFALVSLVFSMGIHATGRMKRISIINGSLYMSVIPFTYIAFRLGYTVYTSFVFNVIAVFIGCLSNVYTLSLYIKELRFKDFITKVLLPISFTTALTLIITLLVYLKLEESWLRFILTTIVSSITILIITYFITDDLIRNRTLERIRNYVRFS